MTKDLQVGEERPCCGGIYPEHFPSCQRLHMSNQPNPVPAPQPSLRKAAVETVVAGELLLSFVERNTDACNRFRKALEQLAEELGK